MVDVKQIDQEIRDFYQNSSMIVSEELIDAILYSVEGGGKRIRPVLLLQIVKGFGVELKQAHYQVAAALEMIHTGSLVHDDLPAMDDDDYRRGRLTNHKKFDEATAILTGDSLFLDAFRMITLADLPSDILVQMVHLLSTASGTFGMVGGQMLDMLGEGRELDVFYLVKIHENKTGRLLTFPFHAAGIIAQQPSSVVGSLWQAGMLIGHAFQVRDDILDVTADFDELGKTPQKDLVAEKATYPSLLGLEESKFIVQDSLDKAVAIFKELEEHNGFKGQEVYQLIESLRING